MNNIELALHSIDDVNAIMSILLDNDYVCMVSREDNLYIVNAVWSYGCNRNDMMFMSREEFDDEYISRKEEDDD